MPASPRSWPEKLKRNWANTRLAQEAVMLDQMQKQNGLVRRLVRKTQDGSLGTRTEEPEDAEAAGEAEMGVMVGNEIHYHYPSPATPEAVPEAAAKPAASSGLSKLATAGVLAAAIGGGGGLGALVAQLVRPADTAAPTAAVDADTQYDLRLTPPDP